MLPKENGLCIYYKYYALCGKGSTKPRIVLVLKTVFIIGIDRRYIIAALKLLAISKIQQQET